MSFINYHLSCFNEIRIENGWVAMTLNNEEFWEYLDEVKEAELDIHNQDRIDKGLTLLTLECDDFSEYFIGLTRHKMSQALVHTSCTLEERREQVAAMYSDGWKMVEMSRSLGVSVKTIQTDFKHLKLVSWTKITSAQIREEVQSIISSVGSYIGRRKISWYLLSQKNIRATKKSILLAMVIALHCVLLLNLSTLYDTFSNLNLHLNVSES